MEKEGKIIVVLIAMALSSLSIAYITFFPANNGLQEYSDSSNIGEEVYLEGTVLGKHVTYNGDHLILNLKWNSGLVKVFVPNSNGAETLDKKINKGFYIHVEGAVDKYKGKREIIIQQKNDISVVEHPQ
ncbi:nucleic acid binding OB-fold tRNA/helicase-type [Methanohalobium evestigatum Z-7303]|uniref:Nucleic acid binding OB-fold tRNA/helicase-type n=1 Tax=Methanohalobium evestigatum (strain ATCC BAA-1072 / DSM 3721 / NBRC 107634 / OCM 161 / Z-7303) TaxID=644295 RepID=D7E9G2_METEZ|nr:OB-fold nucleic acid binding domain-containing protein [Methanohalobium evestigatum]ADI74234.1 nucleic acid binding OB-fold tRNA/helicase-type [Methanohalobium evestigatum Z-7303]